MDSNTSVTFENETASSGSNVQSSKLVSDEALYWGQLIGHVGLSGPVCFVGVIANTINIIVFIRQGVLKDSNTVSLLALSISDLLSVVTLLWASICFLMIYAGPPELPFDIMSTLVISGGRPHVMFVQITSWLTVYIAFERCMCVVFPFKVGRMFSVKKTILVILCISIIIPSYGYIPLYIVEHLRWRTNPHTNKTILRLYRTKDYSKVMDICSILNAPVSRTMSLAFVFCFTQITAFRVNASRKWRMATAASHSQIQKTNHSNAGEEVNQTQAKDDQKEIGSRDKRLVKMIRAICTIFLVCLTPNLIFIILQLIEPKIGPRMQYNNFFYLCYALSFLLEAINATINIFVYYRLSSKYRNEFRGLLGITKTCD